MFHVNPEGNALRHCLPFFEVTKDALPAASVKFGNTVFLNLCLTGKAKFPFHLQLYRQAVRIPAGNAWGIIAFHCLIARDNVLEDARQHMMDARTAIRRGRSLVKGKAGTTLAILHAPFKDFILLPPAEYLFLNLWQIELTTHGTKHKQKPLPYKNPAH
ncbi:hypothetical protein ES703_55447 [subsurface metagenome]